MVNILHGRDATMNDKTHVMIWPKTISSPVSIPVGQCSVCGEIGDCMEMEGQSCKGGVPRNMRNGCCCVFADDSETQTRWCAVHAAMRDRIAALEAELAGVRDGTHWIAPVELTDRMRDAIDDVSCDLSDQGDLSDLWDTLRAASQEQDK